MSGGAGIHRRIVRRPSLGCRSDLQWQCLAASTEVEGHLESLLVKVTSERRLLEDDLVKLGCFREAYQSLRECIRQNEPLPWYSRSQPESESYRRYVAFKSLAEYFAHMLNDEGSQGRLLIGRYSPAIVDEEQSRHALLSVTVGNRRYDWLDQTERLLPYTQARAPSRLHEKK
jgi:hypothetical protein